MCETDLLYPPKSVVLSVMDPPPQPPSSSTSSSSSSSSTASKVDEVLVGVVQLGQIECPLYGRRTPILHVQGAELPNMDADLPEDMNAVPAEGGEARQGELPNMDAVPAEGGEARQGRGASYYVLLHALTTAPYPLPHRSYHVLLCPTSEGRHPRLLRARARDGACGLRGAVLSGPVRT